MIILYTFYIHVAFRTRLALNWINTVSRRLEFGSLTRKVKPSQLGLTTYLIEINLLQAAPANNLQKVAGSSQSYLSNRTEDHNRNVGFFKT